MTRRSTSDPKPLPAPAYLRECLSYDPTGILVWRHRPQHHFFTKRLAAIWNARWPGRRAGSPLKNGYRLLSLDAEKYLENRIIYHMEVGPVASTDRVDHRDCDHTNNRKENFRLCTHAQNLMNQAPRRARKYDLPKHVHWSIRERKYKVTVRANGRAHFIGTFAGLADADAAAIEARRRLHGQFEYRGAA